MARGYLLEGGGSSTNPADFANLLFDASGNPVPVVPHFDLQNPKYTVARLSDYVFTDRTSSPTKYFTNGVYVQDQIKIGKLQALLGLRQEFYTDVLDFDRENEEIIEQSKLLPRIGLIYSISPSVNLFGTYTESFQPQRALIVNNPLLGGPFAPTSAYMAETGAKGEFFKKRLSVNLALYFIENNNILINANDPVNPDLLRQRGQEQSRGFEIDINGAIGSNLNLTANYAYNLAEITESDREEEIGQIKENAPKHAGGIFANYGFSGDLLKGFNLNMRTNFVSERNTFIEDLQLPKYMVWDAGASYKVNKVKLALTINNLCDETHWVGGYSYVRLFPGAPRNWLMNVSYNF
ncbi:MAG: iron complex outermembrane receptor protein [Algoriphagus sp.]